MKIHLDTDLGGDLDDLCALAMLLKLPDVVIKGITVVGDTKGKRTGYVKEVLKIAKRSEIPVKTGAENSLKYYRYDLTLPDEEKYWPEPVDPSPNDVSEAIELLKKSIDEGATIICIGPLTNLYLLDQKYPGILKKEKIFIMGGFIYPIRDGYPRWTNKDDFNIQIDAKSSLHVLQNSTPTLIPLTVTAETYLCKQSISILEKANPVANLIAKQMQSFARDEKMAERFGKVCKNLPEDLVNFQHDALVSAVAIGFRDGVEIKKVSLAIEEKEGFVVEKIDPKGREFEVVTKVDAKRFEKFWNAVVCGK